MFNQLWRPAESVQSGGMEPGTQFTPEKGGGVNRCACTVGRSTSPPEPVS